MTQSSPCPLCASPQTHLPCELCHTSVCKDCLQFIEQDRWSFLPKLPNHLTHSRYCQTCFQQKVAPEMEQYDSLLAQAKEIVVYEKKQGKETRLFKRTAKPIMIKDCADHDEAILRLAFLAARDGYNAIIDLDMVSKKVRYAGYQTTIWSGTAVPTNIDIHRKPKNRALWQNPN